MVCSNIAPSPVLVDPSRYSSGTALLRCHLVYLSLLDSESKQTRHMEMDVSQAVL